MAITVHKAQGQTFARIGVLQLTEMFAHGQLYVALSRVRNWQSLSVQISTLDDNHLWLKNIVYQEVLTKI